MFYAQIIEQVLFPVEVVVISIFDVVLGVRQGGDQMLAKLVLGPLPLQLPDSFQDLRLEFGDAVVESSVLGLRGLPLPQNFLAHVFLKLC